LNDRDQYRKELEYIKREDVLDEAGRQRPILIQSSESDLLEKLQVNEFLYEAQQARNPVPPIIEKVAQLLAMLHEGQQRSDAYLGDLQKSNGLVSALRQRNMALFTRTQMFESFKTRALLRYVMNLVEGDRMTDLHLDGLSFGQREISEMLSLLARYEALDKVFVISLIDNGLGDDSVNLLLQLMFQLPYLRSLDLRRNCIGPEGIKKIEEQFRAMEGVTGVIRTANQVINIHSGSQLRLAIDISEQVPKEQVQPMVDFSIQHELHAVDADPFLATSAGMTTQPFNKTAPPQKSPQKAMADPSAAELAKPSAVPPPPAVGGPPVGLGGPGNVAALNKKAGKSKDKVPDPKKRSAKRAKAAPPPMLEYIPNQRVLDKWQVGAYGGALAAGTPMGSSSLGCDMVQSARPSSALRFSSSRQDLQNIFDQDLAGVESFRQPRLSSIDRSVSMPTLRKSLQQLPSQRRLPSGVR